MSGSIVYHYHPVTKAHTGESLAAESPLEPGTKLCPANATFEAPGTPAEGYTRNFIAGVWQDVAIVEPEADEEDEGPADAPVVY